MNCKSILKNIFLFALLFNVAQIKSQNLLVNGDFETGTVVGFFSNGAGYVRIFPPFTGSTTSGNWAFTNDPQPMNTASFVSGGDHTTGSGLMLVFDGNTTGGQQNFWEAGNGGGGVCGLTIGGTYTFSYWIKSVYGNVTGNPTPADIRVDILNANSVTLVSGSTVAPPTSSGWQQVTYTFVAAGNCANIKMYNNNTSSDGNDFAIDDIAVIPPPVALSITTSSNNPTCNNASDGFIIGYGVGGVQPYALYNLTGTVTANNTTGIFNGLPAGPYTIKVTDANGATAQRNVTLVNPPGITASADTAICLGQQTTLNASGSTSGYTWSASPNDTSLTTPNIANPIVSPTQTTTYTVTSTSNVPVNLITNGNFSSGNIAFQSDYQFLATTLPAGTQKTYGVTTNSNTWFAGFSSCIDHSGTGIMMVVDGSVTNAGNDMVWGQTVVVNPNQNYNFSFWMQSVAQPNPAQIRVVINGVTLGTFTASTNNCEWNNYAQGWNSGTATTAVIELYDSTVTASGNDFALDDITFTTNNTCVLTDQVLVTVNSLSPTITCGTATPTSQVFNWSTVTGATNYTISYTINNGTPVNAGNVNATTYTIVGINPTDSIRITVTPNGTGCFTAASLTCGSVPVCPQPNVSVTQQPTCAVPTGIIEFTSPLNTSPLPVPTELFISEVTDESVGSLTYIEIYNGTGTTKNLSNYKIKVYNNGNAFISPNCDIQLSGTLNNNDVFVLGIGSATNQGGVSPDLVVANCGAINENDNIRLTSNSNVEIDNWGRRDGVDFTPANQAGYTFRRLQTAPKPTNTWNINDWTALDPQDYTEVGNYVYQTSNYEYSVNGGTNYQSNPIFTGLIPGNYSAVIRDIVSGCVSTPIPLVLNPLPTVAPPTVLPVTYCQNATAVPLTATPSAGGTLNWYLTNNASETPLATVPTPSTVALGDTIYYVSQTIGGCESVRVAITVRVTNLPPNATPNLFCANSTPTSAEFDFNSIGQTNYTFSYSIEGGTPVTGVIPTFPSSYIVNGLTGGQSVTLTITWNGLCTTTRTATCFASCTSPTLITTAPAAVCSPNTVDLTLPAVTAGSTTGTTLTYWTNAAATNPLANPNAVSAGGIYYIKSTIGTCSTIQSISVTIHTTPVLSITNPPAVCAPSTVDITSPAVTAGSFGVGTLTYWTDSSATIPLANPSAISSGGTYYIKATHVTCFDIEPVTVTINPSINLVITNPTALCSGIAVAVDLTSPNVTLGSTPGTLTYWTNSLATSVLNSPNAVTAGGTYYIKLTVGICTEIKPVLVTINQSPTLVITNPSPVCSPASINLTAPTITVGSSSGTKTYWTDSAATIPLSNPNTITSSNVYYIKLANGSCFDIQPVTVTINPTPTLVITNPASVCSPATINLQAPAITAGSTGSGVLTYWTNLAATNSLTNPNAVSSSGTYYIKSTVGDCFDIESVTVVVNPRNNPIFSSFGPYCEGVTIPALPTSSNNSIPGTWNPAIVDNTTTTTYTFTPNINQCANTYPLQIVIIPVVTPTVDIVESCGSNAVTITSPLGNEYVYSLDSLPVQSSPFFNNLSAGNHSIVAIQTIANCISNPLNFTINAIANDVVVNSNPLPLEICDLNNDGFGAFDLTSAISSIVGANTYTITYHETEDDANLDGTTIPNPSSYNSINPLTQTIYIRVESTITSCFEVVELELIVNPTPEATIPDDLHLCDYTGAVGYEPFDLTLVIPQVLGSINPATHVVTFYNDATNAQQGINNITSTSGYINGIINQETIYVRVETIATGCFDIVDFDIIVDPLPLITTPNYPQYSLCDKDQTKIGYEIFDLNSKVVDILLGQTGMSVTFYPSLTDAQNNTNSITNLNYENIIQYVQTLGIRITNTTTNCYVISTMDIRVEPLPSPIPPIEPYTVCDDNQDGVSCAFDLTTLVADLVQSANYTITFHETQDNANEGDNAIDTTVNYCNIDPFVQLLYVRAVDNLTGCWSTLPIELNVNPSPSAPVNVPNIEVCDTDTNTQNAITNVNLAQQTAIVLAQQPLPATSYVVTYHTNPTDAGTGNNEIVPITSYSASNGQTIWVRVENIATGCYNVGSFQVLINIPLIVATPTPINECDDDANPNDQFTNFDLTVRTIAPADHTLNYYPSLGQAQSNTNEITTITNYTNTAPAVQTLGVKITTPAGCVSYTTLNVRVLPIPEPLDPSAATPEMVLPAECENGTNSGQQILDLTLNEAYIKNGETTLELHYFPTLTDLENNTNELLTPNAALVGDTTLTGDPIDLVQYVYIAVSSPNYTDYTGRDCFEIIKQGYIINPLPTVNTITYRLCETAPIDQTEVFDLTTQTSDLLAGNATTPSSTYSLSYYTDASLSAVSQITTPSAFTNTSDPQIIYVVATNNSTGCQSDVAQMTLAVEEAAFATGPQIVSTCDDYDNPYDGVYQLDLTSYADEILAGQNPAIFLVSYYTSQVDAIAGTNALSLAEAQLYTTDADVDTIWVKVENSSNTIVPVCYAITTIEIDIERYPNPIIDTENGVNTICVNYENDQVIRPLTLESGITNPLDYTFEWFEGTSTTVIGTDPNYIVNTAEASGATRSYTVKVTSISALGCSTTSEVFEVIQSGPAVVATGTTGYTVTNAFSDNQIITVTVEGYGTYQYSIDDGPRQDSNIFENVSFGEHTIYVWDTEGGIAYSCEVLEINNVQIIDYPHYFTPNGDGIHDTWNIVGLSNQPTAKIYIFDRYGKLLKQISSTGDGWDGSYNGQPLPSTDYWFSVEYLEQNVSKEFKAHFSLKR